ncbi:MAG: hypothetical protein A2W22_02680 [Candidatus Levybacteria bacterium RBG_16_35_11]|nr:MAG: hypothetical protein A2W22_02680 [Candidatus Levybacteria bacterium RBG_16_35_11]
MKINGVKFAQRILDELKEEIKKRNLSPKLAIILMGDNPISQSYVKKKEKKAKEIGIKTIIIRLASSTSKNILRSRIEKLNSDKFVHGIIIQRPLPSQITENFVTNIIIKEKDVDGFREDSSFESPMSQAVYEILNSIGALSLLKRKKTTIIGKGETGGKPILKFLKEKGIRHSVIDSKTKNPQKIIQESDIIISAVGKPVINAKDLKKGVILIGVGMYKNEKGELSADYNQKEVEKVASFYTPVPGGVGPLTVAMLLKNVVKAAQKR